MVDDGKGGRTKKMLAPRPSHVAKWVSDNVALVVQTFDSYVDEGKAYLTTRDANGASAGESAVVHAEATAALAAYRLLLLSPTCRVDGVSRESEYPRRYQPVDGGWLGYLPEDWYRCIIMFSFFNQRRRTTQILTLHGPKSVVQPVPYRDITFRPSVVRGPVGPENFKSVANMTIREGLKRAGFGKANTSIRPAPPQGPAEAARALRRQAMRTGLVEQMYSTERPLHEHLEEKNAESVLPPISFEQIDGLLGQVASNFVFRSTPVQAEVASAIVDTAARQEFISHAMAEQDDADAAAVAQSFARSSVISMLRDCAGELAEAVDIVGMDDWRRLAPDPSHPGFTLKSHHYLMLLNLLLINPKSIKTL